MWILLEKFGAKIAAVLGVIIGLFLMLKSAKDKGQLEQKLEDTKQANEVKLASVQSEAKRTEEVLQNAHTVSKTVSALSASDVDRQLHDRWNG